MLAAVHSDIDYPLTGAEVIDLVRNAILSGSDTQIEAVKDQFEGFNSLGCPLS